MYMPSREEFEKLGASFVGTARPVCPPVVMFGW